MDIRGYTVSLFVPGKEAEITPTRHLLVDNVESSDLDEGAKPVPEGDFAAKQTDMYYASIDLSGKLGWEKRCSYL